jgi:hypothetical protein
VPTAREVRRLLGYTVGAGAVGSVVVVVLGAAVLVSPWFTLLSLNTLFGLGIPIDASTLFATLWLQLLAWWLATMSSAKINTK